MKRFLRFCRTVAHLRPQMIGWRFWRSLKRPFFVPRSLPAGLLERVQKRPLFCATPLVQPDSIDFKSCTFNFLNKSRPFAGGVNWAFGKKGCFGITT